MATSQEIMEALIDFQQQCNDNKRLRRMQRDWTRLLHYVATDTGDAFTMRVVAGETTDIKPDRDGTPDVIIETDSETMCDMFWGDINPTQKYMRGEIKVKTNQKNIIHINTITTII